jgi:uncharacterized membrane protein (TIGR02234 family)
VSARRELLAAALLCAAGAGLIILAAGRRWSGVDVVGAGTPISQALTGRDLAGPAAALGWAGLGGLAALLAVRGRARTAVGAVLAVFGAGAGYDCVAGVERAHVLSVAADKSNLTAFLSTDVHTGAWWAVAAAGGVLLAAAGLLTVLRGARWPGMSARYEPVARGGRGPAPGGPAPGGPAVADSGPPDADAGADADADGARTGPAATDPSRLWQALDRGEDPTDGRGRGASRRSF